MADNPNKSSKRVLDPSERFSEILFGVIMVLTFTSSLRVAQAGRAQVREILIGAIGCNLAWGIIDALMYLMACVSEHGHKVHLLNQVHKVREPAKANRIIADELPPVLAAALPPSALDAIRQKLFELPDLPVRPRLTKDNWRGALGVFLLVFLSTFPIVIPFLVIPEIRLASRLSDAVAIAMLFLAGFCYGRYAGHSPWGWGISMVLIGSVMVGLTVALGG